MSNSGIEWTDSTWEVTAGCTKVSSGCANCYAERLVGTRHAGAARKRKRDGTANGSAVDLSLEVINGKGRWSGDIRLLEMNLSQPLSRRAPTVYFVNSRSDLFHPDVPFSYIDRVFAVMALCPRHRFLVLTKRPGRMRAYLTSKDRDRSVERAVLVWHESQGPDYTLSNRCDVHPLKVAHCLRVRAVPQEYTWPLPNVWLGTSVEDQETANTRLPELLACPAAGRFVSAEPLLDAVELGLNRELLTDLMDAEGRDDRHRGRYPFTGVPGEAVTRRKHGIDWVIVGGESGPGARDFCVSWAESIVEQCRGAGVPVFVKQLGPHPFGQFEHEDNEGYGVQVKLRDRKGADPAEWPADLRVREVPAGLSLGVKMGGLEK